MKALFILFLLTSPPEMFSLSSDFTKVLHQMPISNGQLRDQLVENDLVGEKMGFVVRARSPFCGVIHVSFLPWLNGEVFNEYFKNMSGIMNSFDDKVPYSYKIYDQTFKAARTAFTNDVKSMLNIYGMDRGHGTDVHSGGRHERAVPALIVAGLGFATWFGVDMIRGWFTNTRMVNQLDEIKTELKELEEWNDKLHFANLRTKFTSMFNSETVYLRILFRYALQSMMEDNNFSGALLHEGAGSILQAVKSLMGEKFDDSVVNLFKARSSNMITASVRQFDPDVGMAKVQVCVPDTTTVDKMEMVRIMPTGLFDGHMEHFTFPHLPEFYAIGSNATLENALVVDLSKCKLIGSIHLCEKMTRQSVDCQLVKHRREHCDTEIIDAKESHFTHVRSLVTAVIVATKERTADYYPDALNKQNYQKVTLEKSVAVVVLPKNTCMNIGGNLFFSRIVGANFSIQYPKKTVEATEDEIDESMGRWNLREIKSSSQQLLIISMGIIVFLAVVILLFIASFTFQTIYMRRYANKKDHVHAERRQVAEDNFYGGIARPAPEPQSEE